MDAGVVRLYDIVLIRKTSDGSSARMDLTSPLDGTGGGFEALAGGSLVITGSEIPGQLLA